MRVLDLFSGIGGFSLGLERAGMRTVAFCEIEPYCRAVLAKHWPGVPCFPDIRGIDSYELGRLGGIDLICGGFPCQDISYAGAGAGITGERSGLWREYARVIGLVRPRYVVVENVSALLNRGLGEVLGDLAAIGYDAEWHCIPASYVGAPHRRDRIWIIAYPNGDREHDGAVNAEVASASESMADASRLQPGRPQQRPERQRTRSRSESEHVANATLNGRKPRRQSNAAQEQERRQLDRGGERCAVAHADSESSLRFTDAWTECDYWVVEPDVGRVANGIPARVDRLKALGNAVVPQIPEIIGRAIMQQVTALPKNCEHAWQPVTKSNGKADEACTKCGVLRSTESKECVK